MTTCTASLDSMSLQNACEPVHSRTVRVPESDGSADRVLLRPESVRHGLIDDDYSGRAERILMRELSPFQERNTHSSEIVRASDAIACARQVSWLGGRLTFDLKTSPGISFEGQMSNSANGHNTRHGAHMRLEVLAKARESRRAIVELLLRNRHLHRKHIFRVQPRIDAQ